MYVTKKWAVSATVLMRVLLLVQALVYSGGGSVSLSNEINHLLLLPLSRVGGYS